MVVLMEDSRNKSTNMGPMMMHPHQPSQHFDNIMHFIERIKSDEQWSDEPLMLLYGSNRYQQDGAYFVESTIFISESDDIELVQNNIFGPIMVVLPCFNRR